MRAPTAATNRTMCVECYRTRLARQVLPSGMKSEEAKDDQQWQFPCSRHSGAFGALQMERVSEGCFLDALWPGYQRSRNSVVARGSESVE